MKLNILLVDDEKTIVDPIVDYLELNYPDKYNIFIASSGEEAERQFKHNAIDIVVSDYNMMNGNGLDLIKKVKEANPDVPFILMTGHADKDLTIKFNNNDCFYMFEKPFDISDMVSKIEEANIKIKSKDLKNKFSFLGESQASVLHDINNPLTVIMGNAEILEELIKGQNNSEKMLKCVKSILTSTDRIEGMVKNYKRLLNPEHKYDLQSISLTEFFKFYLDQLKQLTSSYNVYLDFNYNEREDCNINVNPMELSRIFDNLIINSIHATKGLKDPSIKFSVEKSKSSVEFYIEDNGPEISKDVRKDIFTKNFTTKKNGTGMGLSTSREVINSYFGDIVLLENPKTTFVIKLPISKSI